MNTTVKKERRIGIKFIFGWIFGLLFLFTGGSELFTNPLSGIFFILAALVIFPPFMQLVKNKTGIALSSVLRIVLFLILLGIGAGINSDKSTSTATTQTSNTTSTPTPTPIVLNLSEFIDLYGKNKVAVQTKYSAKRLQLAGFVTNISSDFDKYYVEVAPTNDQYYFGTTIHCYFVDKASLVDLAKGQALTIAGTYQDSSYETWIELHDCSVVK